MKYLVPFSVVLAVGLFMTGTASAQHQGGHHGSGHYGGHQGHGYVHGHHHGHGYGGYGYYGPSIGIYSSPGYGYGTGGYFGPGCYAPTIGFSFGPVFGGYNNGHGHHRHHH